jgi:membrane-associated phospholipid phosphatase
MSIDAKRRLASAAFAVLLMLSVFWPAPAVSLNQFCCHAPLPVDTLSFLGREAPSWDVVFWCLAGLLLIAILRSAPFAWRDFGAVRSAWRPAPRRPGVLVLVLLGAALGVALATAAIWRYADPAITAYAEGLQTGASENVIRLANRFGGGMNPPMIILFYLVAGVVYRVRRWIHYAVAMALAGTSAGILVQLVKFAVGRTRPELWLGAFYHARASASSFPSGHTVGAFALAGVLVFAARSHLLRAAAILLALAVAVSRILAFRHWTSDVFASMCVGMLAAWLFVSPVTSDQSGDS